MGLEVVSANEVLRIARDALGVPPSPSSNLEIDESYLAALLRRIAGFKCPCSPASLRAGAVDTLAGLLTVDESLIAAIDMVIERLQACGDLLELAQVTTIEDYAKKTWVFAAPPTFVIAPSGVAYIFGLSPEEVLPLPEPLRARVQTKGTSRLIEPESGEDLKSSLDDSGYREQSIETWLRLPKETSAAAHRKDLDSKLDAAGPCGQIAGLRIYISDRGCRYADRWQSPKKQSGRYIGRRPQAYGADLWGYAELKDGVPSRFIDFPLSGSTFRGCDEAWRLQLALDDDLHQWESFQVRETPEEGIVSFQFPIPLWAQRRFDITGTRTNVIHSGLIAYRFRRNVLQQETEFIERMLWMKKTT